VVIVVLLFENLSQKQIQIVDLHIQGKFFKIDDCHPPVFHQNVVVNIFSVAVMAFRQRLPSQLLIRRCGKTAFDLLGFPQDGLTAGQIRRLKLILFILFADKRIDLAQLLIMAGQLLRHIRSRQTAAVFLRRLAESPHVLMHTRKQRRRLYDLALASGIAFSSVQGFFYYIMIVLPIYRSQPALAVRFHPIDQITAVSQMQQKLLLFLKLIGTSGKLPDQTPAHTGVQKKRPSCAPTGVHGKRVLLQYLQISLVHRIPPRIGRLVPSIHMRERQKIAPLRVPNFKKYRIAAGVIPGTS
jgi:hypothetical protein